MSEVGLQHALEAMESRGLGEVARKVFEHYYRQVESGAQGLVPESTIDPLIDLPDLGDQRFDELTRRAALAQVAVVKLNGGLGTSMGMTGPKTALAVRGELTFLDVIAAQVLAQRARYDVDLPLLLMNSFRTREVSLGILDRYPSLPVRGLPLDFLQNAEPKLRADDLLPVSWPLKIPGSHLGGGCSPSSATSATGPLAVVSTGGEGSRSSAKKKSFGL